MNSDLSEWIVSDLDDPHETINISLTLSFELARKLDDLCHRACFSLELPAEGGRDALIAGFLFRLVNSHKAFVREVYFGCWAEAESIARPMFETLILMAETIRDPEFVETYSQSQEELRSKLVNALLRDLERETPLLKHFDDVQPERLRAEIDASGYKRLDLRKIAEKNDLVQLHEQIYALFHNSVHVKPSSISRHFTCDENGIRSAELRPVPLDPAGIMMLPIVTCAEALKRNIDHFHLDDLRAEFDELWRQLRERSDEIRQASESESAVTPLNGY